MRDLKFLWHRGYLPVVAASAFCAASLACPPSAAAIELSSELANAAAAFDVETPYITPVRVTDSELLGDATLDTLISDDSAQGFLEENSSAPGELDFGDVATADGDGISDGSENFDGILDKGSEFDSELDFTDRSDQSATEKPQNGWWKDPETNKLLYFVDGKEVTPDKVWFVDDDGDRHWYEAGEEVAAHKIWYTDPVTGERVYYLDGEPSEADLVWYIDPVTGERFWYEKGEFVEEHAFYDKDSGAWYWADKGGVIACAKDVFIPKDESDRQKGGKWVRIDAEYRIIKGEQYAKSKDDGKMHWWYFDPVTGEMMKNFNYVVANGRGKWVYYDDVMGWMLYGQQYRPSSKTEKALHWYYFDEYTGATQYGWKWIQSQNKTVYYDDVMGWMLHRWNYIANPAGHGARTNWHFFDRYSGALMTHDDRGNAAYESYCRIQGGSSKTNKYITVDKDNFRTIIFEKRGGDWDVLRIFKCGLGRQSANNGRGTQEGFFYLGENRPSSVRPSNVTWRGDYDRLQSDPSSGVNWRVHYVWDQGFHSTVYTSSIPPEKQLERYISNGCVRLLEADAKWLYQNCNNGTRVYIFRRY